MSFSLNEVEAMAKKAARGAGYPWGLAEEAGKATRWLVAAGQDGCANLLALLAVVDGQDCRRMGPTGTAKVRCPLMVGTALSDGALGDGPWTFGTVAAPLLLMPFAAFVAAQQRVCLTLTGNGGSALTDGRGLRLIGDWPSDPSKLELCVTAASSCQPPAHTRATPEPETWEALDAFAHRTYAPATEESRLKGAG